MKGLMKMEGFGGGASGEMSFMDKLKSKYDSLSDEDKKKLGEAGKGLLSAATSAPQTRDYSSVYAGAMQRAAQAKRPIYGAQMMSDENEKMNVQPEGKSLADALLKSRQDLVKPPRRKRNRG